MSDATPAIYQKLIDVMDSVGAIEKSQTNPHFKYKFRGVDDAMQAVQPALIKHGVVCIPQVLSRESQVLDKTHLVCVEVQYTFTASVDGSSIVASGYGEGADKSDKAVAKAMSACFKQVLFQALCIPTQDTPDADNETPEVNHEARKPTSRKPAPSQPKQSVTTEASQHVNKCVLIMKQRIEHMGIGAPGLKDAEKMAEARDICAELAAKIGKSPEQNWTMPLARKLESAVRVYDPDAGTGGEFVDGPIDPTLNDKQIAQLHGLVQELYPQASNKEVHQLVHQAVEMQGFKSTADVTTSCYAQVRRDIEGLAK